MRGAREGWAGKSGSGDKASAARIRLKSQFDCPEIWRAERDIRMSIEPIFCTVSL